MANAEHLRILQQGVDAWNYWRQDNPNLRPDLGGADLERANLRGADLRLAILENANLRHANLSNVKLYGAHLRAAILEQAKLIAARLMAADLTLADLREASLKRAGLQFARISETNLEGANLERADIVDAFLLQPNFVETRLSQANFGGTVFSNVDLSGAVGLEFCEHSGPSCVDHLTLATSKNVPLVFWRGCGLPDRLLDYLPSLTEDAIQFYSCFISHSTRDLEFAERLHADLQNNGVRCWFAPHDLEIGGVIKDDIDRQIRLRDKVILILSQASVASAWVTREVKTALEEEASGRRVLFPVRLDDAIMDTTDQWAHDTVSAMK